MTEKIALIGFGEAGRNIGGGLVAAAKVRVFAYDLLAGEKPMADAARGAGVDLKTAIGPALEGASVVFSLVTASSAIDAAHAAAKHLKPGQTYIDFNSVAETAEGRRRPGFGRGLRRGRDHGAVPAGHRVPVLVSGPKAAALAARLNEPSMRLGRRRADRRCVASKMLRRSSSRESRRCCSRG
jgi:hypothetical protein